MIFIFIIILVVMALILQRRMLRRGLQSLSAVYRTDRNVAEPGEAFRLRVTLKNNGRHTMSYIKVRVNFPETMHLSDSEAAGHIQKGPGGGPSVIRTLWLRPGEQAELSIEVVIHERGKFVIPHPVVYGGDFLGIAEQVRRLEQYREIVVAPREISAMPAAVLSGGILGDYPVRRFLYEDPVLTAGYREYTGREPMKMISWTQSARGLGLMVRTLDHTAQPSVRVILNVDTTVDDRELVLEYGFSLARMVCKVLEEREIPYDFFTNAVTDGGWGEPEVGEGLGGNHFQSVLECLGRATYKAGMSCASLAKKSLERRTTPGGCIFITPDDEFSDAGLSLLFQEATDGQYQVIGMREVMP